MARIQMGGIFGASPRASSKQYRAFSLWPSSKKPSARSHQLYGDAGSCRNASLRLPNFPARWTPVLSPRNESAELIARMTAVHIASGHIKSFRTEATESHSSRDRMKARALAYKLGVRGSDAPVPRFADRFQGWGLLPGALALTRTGLSPARRTRLSGRTTRKC